jgi:hypothetical protein
MLPSRRRWTRHPETAQYERTISVSYLPPRKRRAEHYGLSPDGGAWYQVREGGQTLWDSREVFPCYATLEEAMRHRDRHGYGPGPENDAAVARVDAGLAALEEYYAGKGL